MTLVAVKPCPVSSCAGQRPALGFGSGRQFGIARVAVVPALRRRFPSLRCSAAEEDANPKPEAPEETLDVAEKPEPEGTENGRVSSSRFGADSSSIDEFGGWSAVEPEEEPAGGWKAGILRFGAGVVLAIGVSFVFYSYFEKQGKKFSRRPPSQANAQESSKVLDEAPPQQQEKTSKNSSSPEPDHDDDDVTFDGYSRKDDGADDFDEAPEDDDDVGKKQQEQLNVPSGKRQRDQNDFSKQKGVSKLNDQNDFPKQKGVSKPTDQNDAKVANEVDSDTQSRDWRVVVPAFVDRMHELALSALQALKIVEDGVDPGAVCTRRNYARWLIATSSILTRGSANKVLPAMYIEEETELAFDDITPEDPDFAAIQGLAEAGLIPSKLSMMDAQSDDSDPGVVLFSPDSPLSRQDLVCWKVALHHRSLPEISKEEFQEQSGFMDVDRIESKAWPALVSDLYSGESSIIATAFGFTRMLQPQKPVTNGQAAVALAYGDSSEQIGEEITRLEAEKMADEAVAAEAVMEARTQKEIKALFDGEIEAARKEREAAEKQLEEMRTMLEKLTSERDSEKDSLLKGQATVAAQKDLLREIQQKVDEQLQSLAALQVEVSSEKERLDSLTSQAEEDQASAARLKSELDAEKKSLILARLWAEEEAEKARAHHKVLEEVRQRWASRGIEVSVDKNLDEDNIPGPSWRYSGGNTKLEKLLHRAPIQDVMDKGEDLKTRVNNAVVRYWHAILEVLSRFYNRIVESLRAIRWRISELSQGTLTDVSHRVQDTGSVVAEKFRGAQSSVSDISAGAIDGTKRFADGCRSGIGKITQRFKHD